MLLRNIAGQGVYLYAEIISSSLPKTGDAANITGAHSLGGAAEAAGFATAHPTEIGGGAYWQPLAQGETDGESYAYRWSSTTSGVLIRPVLGTTGGVQLADGVAHCGVPGSSTSTFSMRSAQISNPSGRGIFVEGSTRAVEFSGTGANGIGLRLSSSASGAFGSALVVAAGTQCPAITVYGAHGAAAPVISIDATADNAGFDGGPAIQVRTGAGHGIDILVVGSGKKAVLLAGDAATDAFSIAAGAGSPADVFNADGSVNIAGGGGPSAAPIAIAPHVRQALSQVLGSKAIADAFVRSLEGG